MSDKKENAFKKRRNIGIANDILTAGKTDNDNSKVSDSVIIEVKDSDNNIIPSNVINNSDDNSVAKDNINANSKVDAKVDVNTRDSSSAISTAIVNEDVKVKDETNKSALKEAVDAKNDVNDNVKVDANSKDAINSVVGNDVSKDVIAEKEASSTPQAGGLVIKKAKVDDGEKLIRVTTYIKKKYVDKVHAIAKETEQDKLDVYNELLAFSLGNVTVKE
jgi:hypothetical protein